MELLKIDLDLLKAMPLPAWDDDADKGTRGKLLIVGGSRRIPGAAILAARAALRAGCGSVRVAAPESVALHIGIAVPELMVVPLPETSDGTAAESAKALIAEQCKVCDALVVGPGMDENDETDALCRDIVANAPLPTVVDATAVSSLGASFKSKQANRVLTPHAKEFETLSGQSVDAVEGEERAKIALDWAQKAGVVLALKGRFTHIAAPKGDSVYENEGPTRGLGTAGSGDVLAGLIGSLLAQGMDATQATVWGVHLHAEAGGAVAKDQGDDGLMARDFIDRLPSLQKYLRRQTGEREKRGGGFGLRPG